jgi:hypothetical protein
MPSTLGPLKRRRFVAAAGFLLMCASLIAPGKPSAHGGSDHLRGPVTVAEQAAFAEARPAFERHCLRCHSKDGKKAKAKARAHLDMTRYPFGGHHAGEAGAAIRAALGVGPNAHKATMPSDEPGVVKGDELASILRWADAFDAAHVRADGSAPE